MLGIMKIGKALGEQLADLVQREPQTCDVVFSVGPEKTKVPAVKIILKAASSVFEREFKDKWETSIMTEGDGIPLPDVDPVAFELFVNLIISDTWSADSLKELNLVPPTALNLLELCRRFEISKAIENVEATLHDFIQHFASFTDTSDFLKMSQNILETILSCERIPMDEKEIFECACRWAEHQCQEKMMELTGENFREVLGNSFFEIRFPTMKLEDFTEVSMLKQNMFTDLEKLAVYQFMGMGKAKKAKYDETVLSFKTNPRNSFDCSVLQMPQHFKITAKASFLCHGNVMENKFQVNEKISLLGIGFLGPIEGDTQYDVTVQIKRVLNEYIIFNSRKFKQNIFVRKGRMFHFLFEELIPIEPNRYNSSWQTCYYIHFSLKDPMSSVHQLYLLVRQPKVRSGKDEAAVYLYAKFILARPHFRLLLLDPRVKGANNVPQYKAEIVKSEFIQISDSDVEFTLCSSWAKNVGGSGGSPLAELLFK